jgi:hypothetical protein
MRGEELFAVKIKMNFRKDLETRAYIDVLLNRFYARTLRDETIGYIFEIARLDLEHHLPVIGDFWEICYSVQAIINNTSAIRCKFAVNLIQKSHCARAFSSLAGNLLRNR